VTVEQTCDTGVDTIQVSRPGHSRQRKEPWGGEELVSLRKREERMLGKGAPKRRAEGAWWGAQGGSSRVHRHLWECGFSWEKWPEGIIICSISFVISAQLVSPGEEADVISTKIFYLWGGDMPSKPWVQTSIPQQKATCSMCRSGSLYIPQIDI
jgi:hypothetical protein